MRHFRLIARLDVKNADLIKGIHLEGLRKIGLAEVFANKYYNEGVDELIYLDSVASLYQRKHLFNLVKNTAKKVFIPLTVGGGICSEKDVDILFKSGADKIAINTAAVENPKIIQKLSNRYGNQAIVLSVDAKKNGSSWEAFTQNGKFRTDKNVLEWVQQGVELGAGEVLLTSIDQEGTEKGFDIELIRSVVETVNVPVIASGGMGKPEDLVNAVRLGKADAVAVASIIHYGRSSVKELKNYAKASGLTVRQ